jgi:hypothetical protein
MGAADGVIIAIIITAHIRNVKTKSAVPHAIVLGITSCISISGDMLESIPAGMFCMLVARWRM